MAGKWDLFSFDGALLHMGPVGTILERNVRVIFGWPSVYAGSLLVTIGTSLYADIGVGLIWGGICLIGAGVSQELLG